MSSLEVIPSWNEKHIPVRLVRTLLAPDLPLERDASPDSASPSSPYNTSSSSSGSRYSVCSNSCPSSTSALEDDLCSPRPLPLFHAQKLIACGGTGFALAVIDCENGTTDQLSVPFPQEQIGDFPLDELTAFTLYDIISIAVVGERQLWASTKIGTLHIFEMTTSLRLKKKHLFMKINEPILTIASRPLEYTFSAQSSLTSHGPQMEVLLGIPHGYAVVLEGKADQQGRLNNVMTLSRKVIRFTDSSTNCEVNCIIHVAVGTQETYWCSVGSNIIVLQRATWKKLDQMDARCGLVDSSPSCAVISQLVPSEHGIWSCVSKNSLLTLWDKENYSAKLQITLSEYHNSLFFRPNATAVHAVQSLLIVGTARGDLIVFKVSEKSPSRKNSIVQQDMNIDSSRYHYHHIASCSCGVFPVSDIYATTNQQTPQIFAQSPGIYSVYNIMVVLQNTSEDEMCGSILKAFELNISHSPSTSINSSTTSSMRLSLTPRKLSLVFTSSKHYLPLADTS